MLVAWIVWAPVPRNVTINGGPVRFSKTALPYTFSVIRGEPMPKQTMPAWENVTLAQLKVVDELYLTTLADCNPDRASKKMLSALVGTLAPGVPPDVAAHEDVTSQLLLFPPT